MCPAMMRSPLCCSSADCYCCSYLILTVQGRPLTSRGLLPLFTPEWDCLSCLRPLRGPAR